MKNVFLLLLSFSLFVSCQRNEHELYEETIYSAIDENIPASTDIADDFLRQFEMAVLENDRDQLIALMDESYVRDQMTIFLNGNKEQFVDEFFCGHDLQTGEFQCIAFDEIKQFYPASAIEDNDSYLYITYFVKSSSQKIEIGFMIDKEVVGEKINLTLIGGYG